MKKIISATLAVMSLGLVSCEQQLETANYLKVETATSLTFGHSDTAPQEIFISSNAAWTVTKSEGAGWLILSQTTGTGDAGINVCADKNNTAADREAIVTISLKTDASVCATVNVKQEFNADLDVFSCIKDRNFISYLRIFDTDGNGVLSIGEASAVDVIDVTPSGDEEYSKLITSLEGIEYFPNLISLSCSLLPLGEINVSGNPKLKELICINNNLSSLDVSKNPDLEILYCSQNLELTGIDVTGNPKLKVLFTEFNSGIESIDLSKCPELTDIAFTENSLTEIDLSHNTKLVNVALGHNQLSSVDVTMLPELERLDISINYTIGGEFDFSNNPKLLTFNCAQNRITGIDVTKCPDINTLAITSNQVSEIDLSNNHKLTSFHASNNLFTKLDISGCPDMVQFLTTTQQNLKEIDMSNCSPEKLVSFWCSQNPNLESVWVWRGFEVPENLDYLYDDASVFKEKE